LKGLWEPGFCPSSALQRSLQRGLRPSSPPRPPSADPTWKSPAGLAHRTGRTIMHTGIRGGSGERGAARACLTAAVHGSSVSARFFSEQAMLKSPPSASLQKKTARWSPLDFDSEQPECTLGTLTCRWARPPSQPDSDDALRVLGAPCPLCPRGWVPPPHASSGLRRFKRASKGPARPLLLRFAPGAMRNRPRTFSSSTRDIQFSFKNGWRTLVRRTGLKTRRRPPYGGSVDR
jgi:hypothetical protein